MANQGQPTGECEVARPGRNFKAPRQFRKPAKSDFFDMVRTSGYVVTVQKFDAGNWNERRDFLVDGEVVGTSMKSEKPDWFAMMEEFCAKFGNEAQKAEVATMRGCF